MAVLTLLILLSASPPEVLKGVVLDSSGAAISGAKVELSAAGLSRTAVTNDTGVFLLDNLSAGAYSLRITGAGFTPLTAPVDVPSNTLKLTLNLERRSEDVIVTATRIETPSSMLGVSATVIDREQMVQEQSAPIYELLRDVPGLAVANTSRRGGTTSVYTRGGGKNANLLLIDGVPVNEPGGDFNFAHLLPTNIERIEIVRGPQSASYGSNAAASLIQVTTHQGVPEEGPASGFASFDGGTFATYRYRTGISGALKMFDYSIGAERQQTEGAYANDAYRNVTLSTNAGYRLNGGSQLRLTLRSIGTRVGVPNKVAYGLLDTDAFRTGSNIIAGGRYTREDARFAQRIQLGFT